MKKSRFIEEQVDSSLKQVERGTHAPEVCRKREEENLRLKKRVSDLSLDKAMYPVAADGHVLRLRIQRESCHCVSNHSNVIIGAEVSVKPVVIQPPYPAVTKLFAGAANVALPSVGDALGSSTGGAGGTIGCFAGWVTVNSAS